MLHVCKKVVGGQKFSGLNVDDLVARDFSLCNLHFKLRGFFTHLNDVIILLQQVLLQALQIAFYQQVAIGKPSCFDHLVVNPHGHGSHCLRLLRKVICGRV